jgi:ribosomal protein L11 methyltransferase
VKGYIPETTDIGQLCAEMGELLAELAGFGMDVGAAQVESHEVFEEDWAHAWKKYYKPVRVTERLVVKPTWEDLSGAEFGGAGFVGHETGDADSGSGSGYLGSANLKSGATPGSGLGSLAVIEMDPGMAFGTGTHPTTVLCMRALEKYLDALSASAVNGASAPRVIDVGTGTGILAIAAVKLGASEVLAIDLDPVAVESAERNVALNGVSDRVQVLQGDLLQSLGFGNSVGASSLADIVVANILADVIVSFVDDVVQALRPGGLYITSGIITAKAPLVREALSRAGFEPVEEVVDGEWVAFVVRKPLT